MIHKIKMTGIAALSAAILVPAASVFSADTDIRLNSVGYLSDFPKKASVRVSGPGSAASVVTPFTVKNAVTDATAHTGSLGANIVNTDTQDTVRVADFSQLAAPGKYYVEVEGVGKSPVFEIGGNVFNNAYKTMMLGMYLWRCGTAVSAQYNGQTYAHAVCHINDGYVCHDSGAATNGVVTNPVKQICVGAGDADGKRDGTGGWHDAGDYNKYVVNSGVTVGLMLKAWEHFGDVLDATDIFIGKSGNIPKYLTEVKWNIDWAAKMQYEDGKVSHKLSAVNFNAMVMPERETAKRYFTRYSTAATGSYVGMLAQASRLYRPYDPVFADSCIAKAKRSYDFLKNSPFVEHIQAPFVTGEYSGDDTDKRLWAAAEMWEATGDAEYLTYLEANLNANQILSSTSWNSVQNLASLTYLASERSGKNPVLVSTLKTKLITVADAIVSTANSNGYGRPLGTSYWWGVNGAVASTAYPLYTAYILTNDEKYRYAMQDAVNHLLGRNGFARSFVTGIGSNPPQYPHDRRSAADNKPWPGYLVGGPNSDALNDITFTTAPTKRTCATNGTCYFDDVNDYARNEIAINWNAPMIYALAGLLGEETPTGIRNAKAVKTSAPLVRTTRLVVRNGKTSAAVPVGAKIYSLSGKLVAQRKSADVKPIINKNGVFLMRVDAK